MARKSSKKMAVEFASKHNITLSVDSEMIEISGWDAKLHNDAGGHLDSVRWDEHQTEPKAWMAAYRMMLSMVNMNNCYAPDQCDCGFKR